MDNLILKLNDIEEKYKKALDAIDEKYGPINSIEQQSLAFYEKLDVCSEPLQEYGSLSGELDDKYDDLNKKREANSMNAQKVSEKRDALINILDDTIEEQRLLHDDSGIDTTLSIGYIRNEVAETCTDMDKIMRLSEEYSAELSVIVSCMREVNLHIGKLKRIFDALTSAFLLNVQGN